MDAWFAVVRAAVTLKHPLGRYSFGLISDRPEFLEGERNQDAKSLYRAVHCRALGISPRPLGISGRLFGPGATFWGAFSFWEIVREGTIKGPDRTSGECGWFDFVCRKFLVIRSKNGL